jgi:TM2 domain-containing membrane protein YozV
MRYIERTMSESAESDTKACPYCGEVIKRVAVRCKHCQADLSKAAPEADFTRGVAPASGGGHPANAGMAGSAAVLPLASALAAAGDDFEVRFLEWAYQSTVTINVPAVAHALKRPTSEVSDRLEDMAVRDVLVREVDDEGNVYFTIPGRARPAHPPLARMGAGGQLVHVSAPAEGTAVAAMVLNVVIPGSGSLVAGRVGVGLTQLFLWIIGIPLCLVLIGFPILLSAWIWSLVTGIHILEDSRRRQSVS